MTHRVYFRHQLDLCSCVNEDAENMCISGLTHHYIPVRQQKKDLKILKDLLVSVNYRQAVVFVRDSDRALHLTDVLKTFGFSVIGVHSFVPLSQRLQCLRAFVHSRHIYKIMVTSCCAHVLQYNDFIDLAVNFDEPEDARTYFHLVASRKHDRKGIVCSLVRTIEFMDVLKSAEKNYNLTVTRYPKHSS